MKRIMIAVFVSIGLAWTVATAGAASPETLAVATSAAGSLFADGIQQTMADAVRVSEIFAWVVVAMLVAYLYDSAKA